MRGILVGAAMSFVLWFLIGLAFWGILELAGKTVAT